MSMTNTYLASWYVNGKRDIALVSEVNDTLAEEVVRVRLEGMDVHPDRRKVRIELLELKTMEFILLSHMGHV